MKRLFQVTIPSFHAMIPSFHAAMHLKHAVDNIMMTTQYHHDAYMICAMMRASMTKIVDSYAASCAVYCAILHHIYYKTW